MIEARKLGFLLSYAFAGGFADATSMMLYKTFTGHVTGNLVLLALSGSQAKWEDAGIRLLAIASFTVSTAIGFRFSRLPERNWWLLLCQAVLLLTVWACHTEHAAVIVGVLGLCGSLGLQNGAITSVAGVTLHSTFISGDLTSLLRSATQSTSAGTKDDSARSEKVRVLGSLLTAFLAGAIAAAFLARLLHAALTVALLIPLLIAAVLQPADQREA